MHRPFSIRERMRLSSRLVYSTRGAILLRRIYKAEVHLVPQQHGGNAGVVTVPGSAFGACGEGYLRLVFANSDENLKEAVRRIGAYVSKAYPDMK